MGEDASLEDFLDADGQGVDRDEAETERDDEAAETASEDVEPVAESDEEETTDDAAETADDEATGQATEPAVATFDWTPGGAACAACDETVERRWRDDPGFVCEACKNW